MDRRADYLRSIARRIAACVVSHMYAAAPTEPTRLTQAFVWDALYIWSPPKPAVNIVLVIF